MLRYYICRVFFDYNTLLSYSQNEQVDSYDEIKHPAILNEMQRLDMQKSA